MREVERAAADHVTVDVPADALAHLDALGVAVALDRGHDGLHGSSFASWNGSGRSHRRRESRPRSYMRRQSRRPDGTCASIRCGDGTGVPRPDRAHPQGKIPASPNVRKRQESPMLTFQQVILRLQDYWDRQGCALLQPYDMEVGAGTSHTATFLRALGPEPWRAAYVQPSRRPKDGRYGENPNRLQHYYQFQVVLKPSPPDILDLYLGSLRGARLRPRRERRALRRGRLGEPDARRLGPRLGSVAERHGDHAVHLLPAGRRPRLQPDHRRDHLRPRAPRDVPAGRRERLRPRLRRRHLVRRRVPPERGRAVDVQLRAFERRRAVHAVRAATKARRSACWRRSCRCPATR